MLSQTSNLYLLKNKSRGLAELGSMDYQTTLENYVSEVYDDTLS